MLYPKSCEKFGFPQEIVQKWVEIPCLWKFFLAYGIYFCG